jgi:hypothetical protein
MSCLVSICKQHHDREHGKLGFWHWLWSTFSPKVARSRRAWSR